RRCGRPLARSRPREDGPGGQRSRGARMAPFPSPPVEEAPGPGEASQRPLRVLRSRGGERGGEDAARDAQRRAAVREALERASLVSTSSNHTLRANAFTSRRTASCTMANACISPAPPAWRPRGERLARCVPRPGFAGLPWIARGKGLPASEIRDAVAHT